MSSIFGREGYLEAGLQAGAVAFGAGVAVSLAWRRIRHRTAPIVGLLGAGASWFALHAQLEVGTGLLAGLALLGAAGIVGDVLGVGLRWRTPLSVPGAYVIATRTGFPMEAWVQVVVGVTTVVGGALTSDFDRRWRSPAIAPGLVAISAFGVFATVPDTEHALPVLGALAVVAALGWPLSMARLGSGGSFAVVGLLAWVSAVGGVGRHTAIVGGVASLGLLATEPVSRIIARVRGPLVRNPGHSEAVLMGVAHVGVVYLASRVSGVRSSMAPALLIAVTVLVVTVCAGVAVAKATRRSV